jgi:hypothetical protein
MVGMLKVFGMIQSPMRCGGVESIYFIIFIVYNHWMKRKKHLNSSIPLHKMVHLLHELRGG